jgi:UTP--glucose-1-phosphate uridylyltransferase
MHACIEDHFTPDRDFVEYLKGKKKVEIAEELRAFYERISHSTITFVNQPRPIGFGNAVLKAKAFTGGEDFLVHAGDDLILSKDINYVRRLIRMFEELSADAAFLVERVEQPRKYGVVEGVQVTDGVYRVERIVEKPKIPRSGMVAVAVYVFKPTLYDEIERLEPGVGGEIQLTDAIQSLIDDGNMVYALELREGKRIDLGTSETYWNALETTYELLGLDHATQEKHWRKMRAHKFRV